MADRVKISLINKTVLVDDYSLLEFMFPSFEVREDIFFDYEKDIIYIGENQTNLKKMLERGTRSFISTVGVYDYDLTNRDTLIFVLYDKWGKIPSERVTEILGEMSTYEFMDYFKKYWVLGSSKLDLEGGVNIFDLYRVLGKSKHDIFKVYMELRKSYDDGYILRCVLSFIEKAYNPDMVSSTSGRYLQMLRDFSKEQGVSMKPILYTLYTMKAGRAYKTAWLLNKLGKGELV